MWSFLVTKVQAEEIKLNEFVRGLPVQSEPATFWGSVVGLAFVVAVILAFCYMVYGAIGWITASGDPSKLQTAMKRILWAAVGIVILGSVWALLQLMIQVVFGGTVPSVPVIN